LRAVGAASGAPPAEEVRGWLERTARERRAAGISELPAILWPGGRSSDPADLRRAIEETLGAR
ncbi:MAG: hypothetical protein ACE5JG_05220, partial [Planctomycetota bacterium]